MTIKVLLANDETLIAEALRHLIDAQPDIHVVGRAENAIEAMRQCKAKRPDVVLMDKSLPTMNGIEATRLLRERLPETRIILLSNCGDHPHVLRALRWGAKGYLLKKSRPQQLLQAIRQVHAGRTYLPSELAAGVIDQLGGAPADPLEILSVRERQVLQMVAEGRTSSEIAKHLSLSPKSVHTYRARMMSKLGFRNITELIRFAIKEGVIPLDG